LFLCWCPYRCPSFRIFHYFHPTILNRSRNNPCRQLIWDHR